MGAKKREGERPTLFETPFASGQPRLFGLAETLGEDGWLKALRVEDYAPRRRPRYPGMLQASALSLRRGLGLTARRGVARQRRSGGRPRAD